VEIQGFSRNSTIDYQVVKCSEWIYSIINILLVVVTRQQQLDRAKRKKADRKGCIRATLVKSIFYPAARRLIYSVSRIRMGDLSFVLCFFIYHPYWSFPTG